MAILQDNMQPAVPTAAQPDTAAAPADQGGQGAKLPAPNPEIMSPVVQAHVPQLEQMRKLLDGKTGQAYDRVLTAGMKMLYSPQTAETVHKLIFDKDIPMPNKLGEGIANLLVMMDNQGNGTIPKEVLVPVGVALMFEAADYMFESGIEVTEDDLGKALELLIDGVFVGYGIDPKKMDKIVDDMGNKLGFDDTDDGKAVANMKGGDVEDAADAATEGPGDEKVEADEEAEGFNKGFADEQTARGTV